MFDVETLSGNPITAEYAAKRQKWERLYESIQIKGDGGARQPLMVVLRVRRHRSKTRSFASEQDVLFPLQTLKKTDENEKIKGLWMHECRMTTRRRVRKPKLVGFNL